MKNSFSPDCTLLALPPVAKQRSDLGGRCSRMSSSGSDNLPFPALGNVGDSYHSPQAFLAICRGLHAAPRELLPWPFLQSWLQPGRSSGAAGHSTRLAPAGTGQHPARLGRLAVKAIPSLERVCLHWAFMALLADTRTVSIFLLCLQLCSLST